jgi:hypothetical protein
VIYTSNNVNIPLILLITINWIVLDCIFCNLMYSLTTQLGVLPENYTRQVRTLEGFKFHWFVTYVSTSYWSLSIGNLFYKQLAIFVPWSLDDPHSDTTKPIFVWLNKLLNVIVRTGCHLAEGDVSLSWACIWSSLHSSVASKRCLWLYPQPALSLSPICLCGTNGACEIRVNRKHCVYPPR